MSDQPFATLGPLAATCTGCGGCCQGVIVHLIEAEEIARIEQIAADMGIADPVTEKQSLRQDQGRCVFLDADNRCRIHGALGSEAKPIVCQQFPFVFVRTESGPRAGLDPAWVGDLATRQVERPQEAPTTRIVRPSQLDGHNALVEASLLRALDPGAAPSLAKLARIMAGAGPGEGPPRGLSERMLSTLLRMPLQALLDHPLVGPKRRADLAPLVAGLAHWRSAPPWPELAPETEAWALDTLRRSVFLRTAASRIPLVQGVALLGLVGAVACGWACPEPARYGPALAAWNHLLRAGPFWQSLTPTPADMHWLATGQR